jgi:hypothetical protein
MITGHSIQTVTVVAFRTNYISIVAKVSRVGRVSRRIRVVLAQKLAARSVTVSTIVRKGSRYPVTRRRIVTVVGSTAATRVNKIRALRVIKGSSRGHPNTTEVHITVDPR